ncbi:MAG: MarC family protein, partial [Gammaproteobacteria bacterium]|nr:MarC family protein [Gammaproteobacteria bacterium]
MLETFGVAFATFFATIGPFDVAAVFAGLTTSVPSKRRRQMALRGTVIAAVILVLFALVG